MDVNRLKKIVAVYVICFLLLSFFVPMKVHFQGDSVRGDSTIVNYALTYEPITKIGYKDTKYVDFITYHGYEKHELVKEILILELISLTVLFAGISFIMCKKSHPH
jgi:hypothetical protein